MNYENSIVRVEEHNTNPKVDTNCVLLIGLALILNVINLFRVQNTINRVFFSINACMLVGLMTKTLKFIKTPTNMFYFILVFCMLQSTKPIIFEPDNEYEFYELNMTIFMLAFILQFKFEKWTTRESPKIIAIALIHYCHFEIWIAK